MKIRKYTASDQQALNRLALASFMQYKSFYSNWGAIESAVANMADLAETSEIFIAENKGRIVGAVALVPPSHGSTGHFDPSWAAIRMLVVSPDERGQGIGKHLSYECIKHATEMGVNTIALHTSPIMEVALAMYLRMGFEKVKDIDPIHGVEYSIYTLNI